jgi:5,6-dimethylbenzimidazole synthase
MRAYRLRNAMDEMPPDPYEARSTGRDLSERDREGFYRVLYGRRDVRSSFRPDPIPEDVLLRVLRAAHHAPSVGFMQPWNFVVVRDRTLRERVRSNFEEVRREGANQFEGERRTLYNSLKLEGILDAPLNICVTCDRNRASPSVLGRVRIRDVDVYSTCLAVQNLWLAARAEGLGVGWVSILDLDAIRAVLGIPAEILPVAYLTIGYVTDFPLRPELETKGWRQRMSVETLIYLDHWGASYTGPEHTARGPDESPNGGHASTRG